MSASTANSLVPDWHLALAPLAVNMQLTALTYNSYSPWWDQPHHFQGYKVQTRWTPSVTHPHCLMMTLYHNGKNIAKLCPYPTDINNQCSGIQFQWN